MATQDLQIVHAMLGRIRVKVGKVKGNAALAEELQGQLSRLSVMQEAVVSPLTGSIVAEPPNVDVPALVPHCSATARRL